MLMTFYLRVSNITTLTIVIDEISAVICSARIYAWVNAFYLILKREIRRNNGLFKDIYQTWSYIIKRYNFRILFSYAVFESKMVKLAIHIYLFFGIKWNVLQCSSIISPWWRCESENTPFLCKQYFSVCKRSNCWSKNQFLW